MSGPVTRRLKYSSQSYAMLTRTYKLKHSLVSFLSRLLCMFPDRSPLPRRKIRNVNIVAENARDSSLLRTP